MSQTHKKTKLIALVLVGLIFLNVNFVSAAINQTLKDALLPFVDIKYDYANGIIDEVIIYNRALSSEEINALYSLSPQGIGETWNCTISAIDSTGAEGINSKAITMPGYALPNITGIKITPSPAYDDSELNCSAVYGNPDGNKGNITLSWYNGSSLFLQTTQYNKFSGETVNEPLTWADKNGLVGYWKFSEGNGTQTRDISGNENNGTLNNFNWNSNSGWVEGKYGKALKFDGVDDYINTGMTIDTSQNYTITGWAMPFNKCEGDQQLIANVYGGFENGFSFGIEGSCRYWFSWANAAKYVVSADISNNIWFHWALVAGGGTAYYYVNGAVVDTMAYSGGGINSHSILIGARRHQGDPNIPIQFWNGQIDEVRIYNRTLSPLEISALYQNPPHATGETWNCTINAIDSAGMTGAPSSKVITIGSQSAQNYTPKWMHVTVTYNKATRQKKIYVNGNLTRTETLQGLSDYKINNQAGNLYAGKLNGLPAGNPFNGSIDEIMISPNEKSAAEIWQDYLNNVIYGEMPGPNEAKTMAIQGENITEISIAPIVKVSKKEKTCDVTSKVNLPECVQ